MGFTDGSCVRVAVEFATLGWGVEEIGEEIMPVDHVAAITSSHGYNAFCVHKGHILFDVLEAIHQVLVRATTPFADNALDIPLSKSRRSCDIRHYDNVPLLSENSGVPSVAPSVRPRIDRTTVDPEEHWVGLVF